MTGHVPMRMCAVCRRRLPKRALLRHVLRPDGAEEATAPAGHETSDAAGGAHAGMRLVPDPRQRAPGRGLYVCESPKCREAFSQIGAKRKAKRRKYE